MKRAAVCFVGALVLSSACTDDNSQVPRLDAGAADAAVTAPDAADPAVMTARGKYLVDTVLGCVDCHTPLGTNSRPDLSKALQGRICHTDTDAMTMGRGCIHSANLTNHETGLKNVADAELRDLITKGLRGNGKKVHPQMPYYVYALLNGADVNAIIAYLRSVPGVDNRIPAHEPPNDNGAADVIPGLTAAEIPTPTGGAANMASAERGRYLTGLACISCHTPAVAGAQPPARPLDLSKAFAGGRSFGAMVRSVNLTPHQTGLAGWTSEQIVRALKEGLDKDGMKVCSPMPSGPMGLYKDLAATDTQDIAAYLMALPPQNNAVEASVCN
jgi:mono/diheme cytochrome c family protein